MPTSRYALISQPDQENLEISWSGGLWHVRSNIVVRFQGAVIAKFQNREELRVPQKVLVPNHPPIFIYLEGSSFRIRQEGKSISGLLRRSPLEELKDFYRFSFWLSIWLLIYPTLSIVFLPFPNLSDDAPFYPYTILPAFLFALIGLITSKMGDIVSIRRIWLGTLSIFISAVIVFFVHPRILGESVSFSSVLILAAIILQAGFSLKTRRILLENRNRRTSNETGFVTKG